MVPWLRIIARRSASESVYQFHPARRASCPSGRSRRSAGGGIFRYSRSFMVLLLAIHLFRRERIERGVPGRIPPIRESLHRDRG